MKNIIKALLVVMTLALVLVAFAACEFPSFGPNGGTVEPNPDPQPPVECKHVGGIATCQAKAVCQLCGESYGELGNHIPVTIDAVEPTCSKAGNSAGVYCSICDFVIVESEEIAPTAHDYVVNRYEGIYEICVCSACGKESMAEVEIPEVLVADITADTELTFALNFSIADFANISLDYANALFARYGSHYVDYVLKIEGLTAEQVVFNANGDADGYLGGQYDEWSENWVYVPFEDVPMKNGESLYIMEYAAELMGKPGLRFTLEEIAAIVQDFDCGVFFTPEFLAANPDMVVTLQLVVFTEDEAGNKTFVNDAPIAENVFTLK